MLRGREELDAEKVIISGGEASLHPKFFDFIRYAKDIGYDRVQTVTNGYRFADRKFYLDSMRAGLGEITFSLHGHNAELHNRLTQTPEGFERLVKGMVRAIRDPYGPIVNIDVVINKQNVGVIDKIIELAASLGVTRFDLLHVIPQSNAFTYRDPALLRSDRTFGTLCKKYSDSTGTPASWCGPIVSRWPSWREWKT